MPKLSQEQINQQLQSLPGWQSKDNAISKLYRFKEFMDGIDFVNRIARIAEAADHHPDILINYTRVTFTCSTHTDGGVTEKDLKLARGKSRRHSQRCRRVRRPGQSTFTRWGQGLRLAPATDGCID